jgi:hypothetical protein
VGIQFTGESFDGGSGTHQKYEIKMNTNVYISLLVVAFAFKFGGSLNGSQDVDADDGDDNYETDSNCPFKNSIVEQNILVQNSTFCEGHGNVLGNC